MFFPESPRWLIHKDRAEEGLAILAKYHGDGDANSPLVQLQYREIMEETSVTRNDNPWWDFRELVNTRIVNVLSKSLGVVARDDSGKDVVVTLLPRNGEVPMEHASDFGTDAADQSGVDIKVMAGERDSTEPLDCKDVGVATLNLPPGLPARSPIRAKFAINRDYPEGSYNDVYLQHVFATIDVFKGYTNTLGFFSGNEVVNNANNTAAATVVKAVTRDMKAYIKKQSKRTIPVGYSAADVAENRRQMADFMNCGSNDERSDFFAFNDYSWCGDSSYTQSGWDQKVANYSDYSIPLFLSEFGCNEVTPRPFTEIKSLYSSDMTKVFSGGLVYEFTQEDNNYGLVKVNGDSIDELTDFKTLKKQYAATPNPSGDGDYQSGLAASTCPAKTDLWQADSTLPDMPTSAQKYLASGAGKPLGTTGPTNQKEGNSTSSSTSSGSSTGSSSAASGSGSSSSKSGGAAGGREMALEGLFFSAVVGLATMAGAMFVL